MFHIVKHAESPGAGTMLGASIKKQQITLYLQGRITCQLVPEQVSITNGIMSFKTENPRINGNICEGLYLCTLTLKTLTGEVIALERLSEGGILTSDDFELDTEHFHIK